MATAVTVARVAIAVVVTVAIVVVATVVTAATVEIAVTVLLVPSRNLALKAATLKARLSNNSNSDLSHEEAGCW